MPTMLYLNDNNIDGSNYRLQKYKKLSEKTNFSLSNPIHSVCPLHLLKTRQNHNERGLLGKVLSKNY